MVARIDSGILERVKDFVLAYRRPSTRITLGYELEFAIHPEKQRTASNHVYRYGSEVFFGLHRDWAYVWEMSSPVLAFQWPPRMEDAFALSVMEYLATVYGFRVSEYDISLEYFDDDERSCGAHFHFRTTPVIAAKMHNWLVVLTPLLAPLMSLARSLYLRPARTRLYEQPPENYKMRFMLRHYASPPRFISQYVIEDADKQDVVFRGYDPERGRNDYFAIELNKYRKNTVTIEHRVNEQHPIAMYVMVDIAYQLARTRTPPLVVNIQALYGHIPTMPTEIEHIEYTVAYIKNPDDLLGDVVRPPELAKRLLENYGDSFIPPTRWALEILASGKRPTYQDYMRYWIKTLEELEVPAAKQWMKETAVKAAKLALKHVEEKKA